MSLDKILVIFTGLFGISFTYWFFLMRKDKEVLVSGNSVDIIVEGGYNPETISVPKGQTTTLRFLRKDQNSCLEEVIISDFKIKKFLPLNEKIEVQITPEIEGEFLYSCSMNMFHGKIIVK